MRRLVIVAALALVTVLVLWASAQGSRANVAPADWDVGGTWAGCSGLVGHCDYVFTMDLAQDPTGAVIGTIDYDVGITGAITGQVSGSGFDFLRADPAPSAYWANCEPCVIAPDGRSFSGTGVDSPGRAVEWQAQGVARHLPIMSIADCSFGEYAGWNRVWEGFVPAVGTGANTPVVPSDPLAAGITYRIEASGTYYAGGVSQFDIEADAEYSQDTYQRVNGQPWTDSVRNYETYGEGLLELKVDGGFVEWGAFNWDHRYTLDLVGMGDPVTFDLQIYDIYAQNNTGGLCAAIYEPYSLSAANVGETVNPIGTTHTVQATISPVIEGVTVTFTITGPNSAESGTAVTNASGVASFTYTGSSAGTDSIVASVSFEGTTIAASAVQKTWYDRFVSGGGQLVEEAGPKRPEWHVISFGGFAAQAGAGNFIGEWQVNFHNVGVDAFDKSSFHTTSIDAMNFYVRDCGIAMNFTATGVWNGIPGYKMIFRAQDAGEPGNLDNARIQLYEGSAIQGTEVYDTYWSGEFTAESDCVGTARTGLDHGNLQMAVLTP